MREEVQVANESREKAMRDVRAAMEENERKLQESARNAEDAVARAQAHAKEEIELLKKRFDVDLAQARQRAERTADETVRKELWSARTRSLRWPCKQRRLPRLSTRP